MRRWRRRVAMRAVLPAPRPTAAAAHGGACCATSDGAERLPTGDLLGAEFRRHQRHRRRRTTEPGCERLAEPDRLSASEVWNLGLLQRPAVHRRNHAPCARLLCRPWTAMDEACGLLHVRTAIGPSTVGILDSSGSALGAVLRAHDLFWLGSGEPS